eukprot:1821207-Pyramimonas_sp.AAC.1
MLEDILGSLRPSWSRLRPSGAIQPLADPPSRSKGGVGGGVNPSPKGKKRGWKRQRSRPPTP